MLVKTIGARTVRGSPRTAVAAAVVRAQLQDCLRQAPAIAEARLDFHLAEAGQDFRPSRSRAQGQGGVHPEVQGAMLARSRRG